MLLRMNYHVIYCTCPNNEVANTISKVLVENKLAACVNILPNITSIYRWQGELQRDQEQLLLIKSRSDKFEDIKQAIIKYHPYELPEIIAVSIDNAVPNYLNWINESLDN
ncbi:MAG: divalent-cation tolerance protein CutA [Gammaproteobacteria bacterium]